MDWGLLLAAPKKETLWLMLAGEIEQSLLSFLGYIFRGGKLM